MDKARRETHHDEIEACYSLFYDTLNYYYCLLFCDDIVLPPFNTSNFYELQSTHVPQMYAFKVQCIARVCDVQIQRKRIQRKLRFSFFAIGNKRYVGSDRRIEYVFVSVLFTCLFFIFDYQNNGTKSNNYNYNDNNNKL